MAERIAIAPSHGGRSAFVVCAALLALVLPVGFVGNGGGISVQSAFATHDNASDQGKGHTDKGGGNSGGVGTSDSGEDNPDNGDGGDDGDGHGDGHGDDDPGRDRGDRTGTSSEGGSGGTSGAAEAEEQAFREAIDAIEAVDAVDAVDPAERPPADSEVTGLPTVREIFALPPDAVVTPAEERALIANGWSAR